jgi:uncharacterized protein
VNTTTATTTHATEPRRANPVLWLVVGLPLLAVVASFVSYALAVTHGDKELPAAYHWEGTGLASDDARGAEAARLRLSASLQVDPVGERCTLQLAGAAPAALRLDLTHPTNPAADRHVPLQRSGDGRYEAPCAALAPAHWWVQVSDADGHWLLRGRTQGALVTAFALSPQGPAPAPTP